MISRASGTEMFMSSRTWKWRAGQHLQIFVQIKPCVQPICNSASLTHSQNLSNQMVPKMCVGSVTQFPLDTLPVIQEIVIVHTWLWRGMKAGGSLTTTECGHLRPQTPVKDSGSLMTTKCGHLRPQNLIFTDRANKTSTVHGVTCDHRMRSLTTTKHFHNRTTEGGDNVPWLAHRHAERWSGLLAFGLAHMLAHFGGWGWGGRGWGGMITYLGLHTDTPKGLQSTTTKYYSSTTFYYKVQLQYYSALLQYYSSPNIVLRLSTQISANAAPANKSDTPTSPNNALATRSETPTWPNIVPATKSDTVTVPAVTSDQNLRSQATPPPWYEHLPWPARDVINLENYSDISESLCQKISCKTTIYSTADAGATSCRSRVASTAWFTAFSTPSASISARMRSWGAGSDSNSNNNNNNKNNNKKQLRHATTTEIYKTYQS